MCLELKGDHDGALAATPQHGRRARRAFVADNGMLPLLSLPLGADGGTIWGVTTTIFEPTPAVRTFVDAVKHSRLVIVGDLKTNHEAWRAYERTAPSAKYLSPDDQRALPYASVAVLPWNHFGRKNVGFLYAISRKAAWIFDFDDDNVLRTPFEGGLLHAILSPTQRQQHALLQPAKHIYNPYPDFHPVAADGRSTFLWPRGFPLDFIHDRTTHSQPAHKKAADAANVHVYQSLANNNPDVDAIYRMTRELPLSFAAENKILTLPNGTYAPFNSQATLFRSTAAWGLALPITVSPRVTDIWRSYITERLLWEMGGQMAFTSPFVTQYRNPHSYQKDFDDEVDLYVKVTPLLNRLAAWTSAPGASLSDAYLSILEELVDAGILLQKDFEFGQLWVRDLKTAGYEWAPIVSRQPARSHVAAPIVDERRNDDPPKGPPPQGRTAVCMTGFPRSLFAEFPDGIDQHVSRFNGTMADPNWPTGRTHRSYALYDGSKWAGTEGDSAEAAASHPAWFVAHSIRNNVLKVLSSQGGYDLFVIEPGSVHNTNWSIMEPSTRNAAGVPDRMYLSMGGPEPDLWYNASDPRWANWFYFNRYGERAIPLAQQLLYQLKHLKDCNDRVREREAASGEKYAYKMRMRPDYAWAKPIPSAKDLAGVLSPSSVIVSSTRFQNGGNNDTFAYGVASAMDVYFDRLPFIHTFESSRHIWVAESFVEDHLRANGIKLVSDDGFLAFGLREHAAQKGAAERTPFLATIDSGAT